jgi:hypothetical protein
VTGGYDDLANLLHVLDASTRSNNVAFPESIHISAPAAGVIAFDGFGELAKRNVKRIQPRRVRLHVILLDVAADCIDARDTADVPQLGTDDPILHRAQVGNALEVVAEPLTFGRQIAAV